ncbi:MAG: HIRAN domain-containing protein [Proteobacteria bacterium]|nr:HIRAN domain-containing protein [Pseudomonadota bacterium]HQR04384.1 HIRAN domain-containing protein [Rhodocyclaceae bacterium]
MSPLHTLHIEPPPRLHGRTAAAVLRLLIALIWVCRPSAGFTAEIRILVQSSPLAGFQYHEGARHWKEMREGDALTLVREPGNPHDPRAVRVEWHGEMLGYLPRAENSAVADEMDRGNRLEARIARLREHSDPWQRLLIDIFLPL